MSFLQPAIGALGISAFLVSLLGGVAPEPERLIEVHELSYTQGAVHAERTVAREGFADWRVTVVRSDGEAPICNTIPGDEIHQGWSRYTQDDSRVQDMSLDTWVGDSGCYARLQDEGAKEGGPVDYVMYVTWTPRDGTQATSETLEFSE